MRKALVLLVFLGAFSLATAQPVPRETAGAEEMSRLEFAAAQHEVIGILLKNGKYSEVLPEFKKILDLDLQEENEKLVVQEAWIIADQLRQAGHFPLAHQILDETLARAQRRTNKFTLLMLKGKMFQEEGRPEEAIQTYRKAQELQKF